MQDAFRAYLDLALGLTETSRKRATKVAKKLVGRGNATAEQLQAMAEDLVTTSLANREALSRLVRFELERALAKVGLATTEEVNALTVRVKELEAELETARSGNGRGTTPAPVEPVAPVKKAVAKKTVAKKVAPGAAEPAAPVTPAPRKTATKTAPAKTTPAKTAAAPATKAVAKKAPAKKAAVKATPAPVGEPA